MSRVLKAPEIRKQEILDTAMKLFNDKGYDATSVADIAKAMNVVPGLCYRYFKSKKEIFDFAVKQYAQESCEIFLQILLSPNKSLKNCLDILFDQITQEKMNNKYNSFYHKEANETFHLQLCLEMYKYIAPHVSNKLYELCKNEKLCLDNVEAVTEFILFGQLTLWLPTLGNVFPMPLEERVNQQKKYIYTLLGIQDD